MLNKFQVKTAMDSFKDSIDSTLASKAEQVATAASQSADLIKKCKQIHNYLCYCILVFCLLILVENDDDIAGY